MSGRTMAGDKPSRSERRRLAQRAAPELIATQRSISYERSGPLPDPSELAGFKQVSPDLPNRIVTMAEEEAAHRRRWENDMLSAQREKMRREHLSELVGQAAALVVALTVIGCSTYVIAIGHPIVGGIGCSATLVSLVTTFIIGRRASTVVKPDVKAAEPSEVAADEQPAELPLP